MSRLRPLPRSLIPLPGESLPGFLLRLSFRLNQPPSMIAALTGLAPAKASGTRMAVLLLAGIPEDAGAFTRMTRLTGAQAARLGMDSWQDRYPPLIAPPFSRARFDSRLLLAPETRYCPDCLAGNGSAVQDAFGGPWLKAWHLPVVFACPGHQRLLEHLCPGCGHPVRERRPGKQYTLLPAARVAGLHPAQCRAESAPGRARHRRDCCGTRLDQPGTRRPAEPWMTGLQDKILDLLSPGGPGSTPSAGQPAPPASYFTDLLTVGLLACATWPAARHLAPSEETAAAIDEHAELLRRLAESHRRGSAAAPSLSSARLGFPPADSAASAGLAHIADRVLAGSTAHTREQLRQLISGRLTRTDRAVWARRIAGTPTPPCSSGLRDALDPLLRGFTKSGGSPQGKRNPVFRPRHWGPEHIPAFLPEDWYTAYFTPVAGVSHMVMRRTASLRLVQMVAGGSLREAAAYLGTGTTSPVAPGTGRARSAAGQEPGPLSFGTALETLARGLDDPDVSLINYQRRRQALQDWCIGEDAWAGLTARLPASANLISPRPPTGDQKRQIASIYVWVQVTSGQHSFAPRPITAAQPPYVQEAWNQQTPHVLRLIRLGKPGPHYAGLKAELDRLATSLALEIDAATAQPARSG